MTETVCVGERFEMWMNDAHRKNNKHKLCYIMEKSHEHKLCYIIILPPKSSNCHLHKNIVLTQVPFYFTEDERGRCKILNVISKRHLPVLTGINNVEPA